MSLIFQIQKDSLTALKGSWGGSIASVMIMLSLSFVSILFFKIFYFICYTFIDSTKIIFEIFNFKITFSNFIFYIFIVLFIMIIFCISVVFINGQKKYFFDLINGKKPTLEIIFLDMKWSKWKRAIKLKFAIILKLLIYTAITTIPGLFCLKLYGDDIAKRVITETIADPTNGFFLLYSNIMFIIGVLLLILAAIISLMYYCRFSLCDYFLFVYKDASIFEIIKLSNIYTKGHIGLIFNFNITFVFHLITSVFIIPTFYTVPHFLTSSAIFAQYIIELGNKMDIRSSPNKKSKKNKKNYNSVNMKV